jgi:TP901 family phage tail tape measure protein
MNSAVTVKIGAALSGNFLSSFQRSDKAVSSLTKSVSLLDKGLRALNSTAMKTATGQSRLAKTLETTVGKLASVAKAGRSTETALGRIDKANNDLVGSNRRLGFSYDSLRMKHERMLAQLSKTPPAQNKNLMPNLPRPGSGAGSRGGTGSSKGFYDLMGMGALAGMGGVGLAGVGKGVGYSSMEQQARADMTATFLKAGGKINPLMDEMNAKSIELGNRLPGTTKDFVEMINVLGERDTSPKDILDGMADSVANLSVLTKQAPAETAMYLTNVRNAMHLTAKEMIPLTDIFQRAHFAGADAGAMSMVFARAGGGLLRAKMTGYDSLRDLSPLVAQLIKSGMSDELIGTNLGRLFNEIGTGRPDIMNKIAKIGGSSIRFTDTRGKFLGFENMMNQIDKIRNFDDRRKNAVIQAIAGQGQSAAIFAQMIEMGSEGYKVMAKSMAEQASLEERMKVILGTFQNSREALGGTFMNMLGTLFKPMIEDLVPVMNTLNDIFGRIERFFWAHPMFARMITYTTVAISGLLAVAGALGSAVVLGKLAFGGLMDMMRVVGPFLARAMAPAINAVTAAFVGLDIAAWPVTLAVLALAGAAFLVYKYWKPISAFFSGFFSALSDGWRDLKVQLGPLLDSWADTLGSIADAFRDLTRQTDFSMKSLSEFWAMGHKMGDNPMMNIGKSWLGVTLGILTEMKDVVAMLIHDMSALYSLLQGDFKGAKAALAEGNSAGYRATVTNPKNTWNALISPWRAKSKGQAAADNFNPMGNWASPGSGKKISDLFSDVGVSRSKYDEDGLGAVSAHLRQYRSGINAPNFTIHSNPTVVIHAAPGQSPEDLGKAVTDQLSKWQLQNQDAAIRRLMLDTSMPPGQGG